MNTIGVEYSDWQGYSLLDSGNHQKLEQFGDYRFIRPEPKAWWRPTLAQSEWTQAHAIYESEARWKFFNTLPKEWHIPFGQLNLSLKCFNTSKHLGLFPEQSPHWKWIDKKIRASTQPNPSVLSLFGYTGVASLVAAAAGAHVTHVDASKPALEWARHNQKLSNLETAPIRWILEDALKFVQRETRRGKKYNAIILDPPSFGRGPKGEVWKAESNLLELLEACYPLLEEPSFVILTLYSLSASALMIHNLLERLPSSHKKTIEIGELALKQKDTTTILPLSIFGRWF
jgi:23S rRNA (cytosine1962-C5)-methyltransferase